MEPIKKELVIWVCILTFLLCWFLALEITQTPIALGRELFFKLPEAVTLFFIISGIFKKWAWRWSWVRDLVVQLPDLQGTWLGELQSKWKEGMPPIPVILVIRQDYDSISCTMFTKNGSDSVSRAAQLLVEESNKSVVLSYVYAGHSNVMQREENPMHEGAANLRVIKVPSLSLEGEYWTGRCTTGYMKLTFRSKDLFDRFPDD